jgi:hypothetical protein
MLKIWKIRGFTAAAAGVILMVFMINDECWGGFGVIMMLKMETWQNGKHARLVILRFTYHVGLNHVRG